MQDYQHKTATKKRIVPQIDFGLSANNSLVLRLQGAWILGQAIPKMDELQAKFEADSSVGSVSFDTELLADWDSSLLVYLQKILALCSTQGIQANMKGLPDGVRRLLALASAIPEKKDAQKQTKKEGFFEKVGKEAVRFVSSTGEQVAFVGEACIAIAKLFAGKARFRLVDFISFLQDVGAQALPIVSLISLLVGLIFAFVGIVQLKVFGAQVYVADLVGIAMVRSMGAIMAGIIMAGRTGASFAAQLGTMQVNEEIDALETLGIKPMEFLVLPRLLALTLMMPLLCVYADLMGIIGGWIVAVPIYGLESTTYVNRVMGAVGLNDLFLGLFMGLVFGVLVALAGCLRGMQCGRSASAVGDATTSAVVTGIVDIIVATALITVVADVIGI